MNNYFVTETSTLSHHSIPSKKFKSRGQGMTEYIIILGLIAIAAIAAFSFFGQAVRGQVAGMASEVSGESGSVGIGVATGAATKAETNAAKNMNMKTYIDGGNTAAK